MIYFVINRRAGALKIGFSAHPHARLADLLRPYSPPCWPARSIEGT